mmetsp:Transcript_83707/g.249853  ORF Transcript_83707/g.249853 Transcript_83707/m.249853 type:complete len:222 (-) Transcript_83707:10-675(-)
MALPPFEVPVARGTVQSWLWALRLSSPRVYQHLGLRRLILSFVSHWHFQELHAAVAAALGPGGGGEVRILRNVTLMRSSWISMHRYVWAVVQERTQLLLRSKGGHWRVRLRMEEEEALDKGGRSGRCCWGPRCAVLAVGRGARVVIRGLRFEAAGAGRGAPVREVAGGDCLNTCLAVLQRDEGLLAQVHLEDVKAQHFCRPLVIDESEDWRGTAFFRGVRA